MAGSQKILSCIQKEQNKILKTIKYYPPGTTTKFIHNDLKIEPVQQRSTLLFNRFSKNKIAHNRFIKELNAYNLANPPPSRIGNKFSTLFDLWPST